VASKPKDPFAKPVLIAGLAMLAGAALVLVFNLISTINNNATVGSEDNTMRLAMVEENIEPIGTVVAVDKTVAPQARTGAEVYDAVCASCHASGVLGSPKLEKEAWSERVAKGLENLLQNAINGINQMPARGGDPTITDQELQDAIIYMTDQAGYDLGADAEQQVAEASSETEPKAASATDTASEMTQMTETDKTDNDMETATDDATATTKTAAKETEQTEQAAEPLPAHASINGEEVYKGICFSCHDSGLINSPILGDKAAWEPRIAKGLETLYDHSINGFNAMPAKGGNPALSDDDVKAAVDYMVVEAGGTLPYGEGDASDDTSAAPAADESTAQDAKAVESEAAQETAETTSQEVAHAGIDGEAVYKGLCFSCHDNGVAGSPIVGDKAAWQDRIAQGKETLYDHSINGLNAMPAKGGNPSLSDDEVKAAVDWMVSQSE